MFVYNLKVSRTKMMKWLFIVIAIVLILFFSIATYRILKQSKAASLERNKDEMQTTDVITITSSQYTNVLKEVHDQLPSYLGKKVSISGYVYRLADFEKNQFVIARDMVISSDMRTLVVGFLCQWKDSMKLENNAWVELTGTITKGHYREDIPIIEVSDIKNIQKPKDAYVYPPDDAFVPTATIF